MKNPCVKLAVIDVLRYVVSSDDNKDVRFGFKALFLRRLVVAYFLIFLLERFCSMDLQVWKIIRSNINV